MSSCPYPWAGPSSGDDEGDRENETRARKEKGWKVEEESITVSSLGFGISEGSIGSEEGIYECEGV